MKNTYLLVLLAAVVVGVVSFLAGMMYGQNKGQQNQSIQQGQFSQRNNRGNMRPVRGSVISSDSSSITVKLQNGNSTIVLLPSNALYYASTKATKDDVKQGTTVAVVGTQNSDGSVTAQFVQINPPMGMGRGSFGQGGQPQPSKASY